MDWSDLPMWTGVLFRALGAISSESWPTVWMILEVNMMSFLPIIATKWAIKKYAMLYYIVQRVGSLVLLAGGLIRDRAALSNKWVTFGLLLKSRLAPMHFWGAAFIVNLSKFNTFIFLTWQKMSPLFLLLCLTPKQTLICLLIVNAIVASFCCIGAKDLRILLFYSGIIHTRWIMAAVFLIACKYFMFYTFLTGPLLLVNNNLYNVSVLILNMAGIPPLSGFLLKLNVLQLISFGIRGYLLIFSLLLLYAYMRIFLYWLVRFGPLKLNVVLVCCIGSLF